MWSIETWEKLSTTLKASPESLPATGNSAVRHILGCCCEKDCNKHVSCEFSQNNSISILRNWEHTVLRQASVKVTRQNSREVFYTSCTFLHLLSFFVIFNQMSWFGFFSPVSVTFPLAVFSTVQSFKPWGTKYHLTEAVSIKPLRMTLRALHLFVQ